MTVPRLVLYSDDVSFSVRDSRSDRNRRLAVVHLLRRMAPQYLGWARGGWDETKKKSRKSRKNPASAEVDSCAMGSVPYRMLMGPATFSLRLLWRPYLSQTWRCAMVVFHVRDTCLILMHDDGGDGDDVHVFLRSCS
jgi:hypothetical protein